MFMSDREHYEGWGDKHETQIARSLRAIKEGNIRTEISCDEARSEWFTMARTMYVDNNSEPRFPIDLEVGLHVGGCDTTECRQLANTYWDVLRPSQPGDSVFLSIVIDDLEANLTPPHE